jgi:hypothetical protein
MERMRSLVWVGGAERLREEANNQAVNHVPGLKCQPRSRARVPFGQ